jgi:DUF4097 and DUF4098 domain-containing protein YvlB
MKRIRTFAVAAALGLAILPVAQAAIESPVHRTFNVRAGGTLIIDADVGDIQVSSGGGSVVAIDVVRKARTNSRAEAEGIFKKYAVTFQQEGNDVRVHARYDQSTKWFHFNSDLDAKFVVTVPMQYNVDVTTAGGDIKVSDLAGRVRTRTSGGDIALGHIQGVVDAKTSGGDVSMAASNAQATLATSGGDIKVGDAAASLDVRTSGGSIEVHRAAADLKAHTSGGSIEIGDIGGAIDASTSGGSIRARMSRQPHGDCRLTTSGGGITIGLAQGVALDIDAHTSGGDVSAAMPVTITGKQEESTLNAKLNGGGPKLVLRSSGGDIRLSR